MSPLPTFADTLNANVVARNQVVIEGMTIDEPVNTNPILQCGCGRRVPADMMIDVRGIVSQDFVCDGCFYRLCAKGITSHDDVINQSIARQNAAES